MKNLIPRSLAAALLLLTSVVAASAQAKVDDVRKQLAQADETIAAARKPAEAVVTADAFVARAEPTWTTGGAKVDGLIRLNAKRYGIDPYLVFCVMTQESHFNVGATS